MDYTSSSHLPVSDRCMQSDVATCPYLITRKTLSTFTKLQHLRLIVAGQNVGFIIHTLETSFH